MFSFALCCFLTAPITVFLFPFCGIIAFLTFGCSKLAAEIHPCAVLCCCPIGLITGLILGSIITSIGYAIFIIPILLYLFTSMLKACNIYSKFNICGCIHKIL